MTIYDIDPERRNPSPLWVALDYVVNAGLVHGDTPEERMQSAIVETQYEIVDNYSDRADISMAQVEEYVKAHYTP